MSKFNKLAVALAATLVVPAAFAITVTPPIAQKAPVAHVDVEDAETPVATGSMVVNVSATDLIIGRTTGFSVRIDLANDAEFALAAPGTVVPGAALPNGWTANLAAGGQEGDSFAVYSVQPGTGATGVVNGPALSFGNLVLANVASLGTAGGTASATVTFADPGTAQPILTPVTAQIVRSANPLAYTVTGGDDDARIDVASGDGFSSKSRFSSNGSIGGAEAGDRFFNAGTLNVGVVDGIRNAGDLSEFAWAGNDSVSVAVTGLFSAFAGAASGASPHGVYLVDGDTACADRSNALRGVVSATGVTFPAFNYSRFGGQADLCFIAPANGTTTIDATTVSTQVTVTRTLTGKTVSATAPALSLAYNGPVVDVDHFNPASNANQQSYLRISNPSSVGGQVNINGVCDDGEVKAPIHMALAAGNSVLLTSTEIENGAPGKGLATGLGACAVGKYRLTVTGEFGGMKVQNFLRNVTSGGMVNTNVNNSN